MRPYSTLLFDLGSTLIYAREPWPPILALAEQKLVRCLHQVGIPIESAALRNGFDTFLDAYYAYRDTDEHIEPTASVFLRELLARNGFRSLPDPILRRALDSMYAVTERNWHVEEDAVSTLASLRENGYRLGLISNASDEDSTQALVDQGGLRPFFDFILTSAGCRIRKPHPRIFQIALNHFKIQPEQAIMVGDTLEADIAGANNLGIYSVWITRRTGPGSDPSTGSPVPALSRPPAPVAQAQAGQDGAAHRPAFGAGLAQAGQVSAIQPKAVIQSLSELPALLESLHQPSP